ncbi:hypothetical protein C5167_026438 [Papaver somniferum]|nr:hypothetical protein C5167_026438 [Papaver somniferum]
MLIIQPYYDEQNPHFIEKRKEYPYCDEVKFNTENIGDYWDTGFSLRCMICHLKFVKIKGLLGCVDELKFLEILFKHAAVLEKVVLASDSSKQDSLRKKRMKKFSEMLLTFPRASKNIIILCRF